MSEDIKENVTRGSIWLRLVFMIVLSMAYGVAELVTLAVVVFQFFASLFAGKPNDQLSRFGRNLARYFQQITVFMTFATEEKPFPFTSWPNESHEETQVEEKRNQAGDKSEKARDVTENDEAAKPKRRATRKSATTQKTRTSRKTNS